MKCEFCGANLKIDDQACPYCGQENPNAKQHRQDMKRFRHEFNATKKDVYATTRRFSKMTVRATIISVLIALNLLLLFGQATSWSLGRVITKSRIQVHAKTHEAMLSRLEEERQFMGLDAYYEENRLYYHSDFYYYRQVYRSCENYGYIYENLMELQNSENSYREPEDFLKEISNLLESVYGYRDESRRWNEEEFSEKHIETMMAVEDQVHQLLAVYCHVPLETVETFPELSAARRQIILEEGMGIDGE